MSQDQGGELGKIVDDPVSGRGLGPEVVTLPDGEKTAPLGPDDIHLRVVTDVRRIGGIHAQLRQGGSKDPWIRLPDSGHLRDDNDVEEAANVEPIDLPPLNQRAPVGYQSEFQPGLLEPLQCHVEIREPDARLWEVSLEINEKPRRCPRRQAEFRLDPLIELVTW